MKNVLISASITTTDFFNIQKTIDVINKSDVDRIHFDVMDGVFVPNITYGPDFISSIKPYSQKVFELNSEKTRIDNELKKIKLENIKQDIELKKQKNVYILERNRV